MRPPSKLGNMMGNPMPDIKKVVSQAHRTGLLTGLGFGFGLGVLTIEIVVHLFTF